MFLDDIAWPGGSTLFEDSDTGGWRITGPPEGSGDNANNWEVTDAGGFPVRAAITTPKSLLFGFGFEGASDAGHRNAVMERIAPSTTRPTPRTAHGGRGQRLPHGRASVRTRSA